MKLVLVAALSAALGAVAGYFLGGVTNLAFNLLIHACRTLQS